MISSFRTGNPVDETDGFECLHLVSDSARVPSDDISDLFTLDRYRFLFIETDEGDEDIVLDEGQIHEVITH